MQVDSTIKDFIFIAGATAVKDQSLPGMKDLVRVGTSSIVYNFLVGPIVSKFTAKFGKPDLMLIAEKILIYPALMSLMGKLIYKESFMYSEYFIDAMLGLGSSEVYDMVFVGKDKKYF